MPRKSRDPLTERAPKEAPPPPHVPTLLDPPARTRVMAAVFEHMSFGLLIHDAAEREGVTERDVREWGLLPEFASAFLRARELQAHAIAEQVIRISDGTDSLTLLYRLAIAKVASLDPDHAQQIANVLNHALIQRDKLRTDARKWYVGKTAPKLYGDKLDITVHDANAIAEMTPEQLDAEAARLGLPALTLMKSA